MIPDIVDAGTRIWNPCQPCNDLARLKTSVGDRLTLWGGIDSQFVLGKPGVTIEEVDREVRRRVYELAPGGGYVAAPSHSVPYGEHVRRAMHQAIERYGREVYRGNDPAGVAPTEGQ